MQSDGTIHTSWSNTNPEIPFQPTLTESNTESNLCPPGKKILARPATTQRIGKENTQTPSVKEKKQKCGKRKNEQKKTAGCVKQESRERTQGKRNESTENVWCSYINTAHNEKTGVDEQFGAVIVEETEEAQHMETVTDTYIEIPQTEICSDSIHSNNAVSSEENKIDDSFPLVTGNLKDTSSIKESELQKEETDPAKQEEYQHIVGLIKSKAVATLTKKTFTNNSSAQGNDFTCETSRMLTGILLPKRSELEPIVDFPENFWGNPQAPVPGEWIDILEWDD